MTQPAWKDSAKDVIKDLRELASLTSDADGAHRVAWTPTWDKAQDWFKKKMKLEGAEISVDSANNVWAKIQGEINEAILIGSHLDCVPNGGWLDGALGVVAGMGGIKRYGKNGKKPKKTLYVVSWADEEGARFGRSCIGSSAVSGALDINEAAKLKDNNGIAFTDALKRYNLNIEAFPNARKEFMDKHIKSYLELHIEQAPVLESQGKSAACVYGITGCERQYITFKGQPAHSGAPISMRRDAFLAAAQASLAFREIGLKHNAYCTVGKVKVFPDIVTIFPGECMISLDQRSIDANILEKIYEEARIACMKAAADNKVDVVFEPVWSIPPTIFDTHLTELCREAVKEETGEATSIFSGPLHDAAEMAKILPSIMMFTMSASGLSHCKEENTPDKDLETAIAAFLRLTEKTINE
ncbi:Zn-dependent hydrolase [Pectinatus haikarae]|uniref:N-carbamoyl-L-amino-acid hydrolase n=1 Tax=Pectinatus haikarae TaxID=349096 RepID=A0ABT9Y7T1_9FIRM|nr:Zn-dependent hydrolase [Pectinatus haikarae]MDQ0203204.1 N-carbamoyl-L-amino-acid hydrolase [Pectinatus haikarae]